MSMITQFDDGHWPRLALARRASFAQAQPFPHVVLDDFLPVADAWELCRCFPQPGASDVTWKKHSHSNVTRYHAENTAEMQPALREFSAAVCGRQFLLFLETISGLDNLIPDPYFIGAGAMASGRGDFLNLHADTNWSHKLQAWHSLNFMLYLTPGWKPQWGGEFQLGEVKVEPLFNRAVIFVVDDDAIHGQPNPWMAPDGIMRQVFGSFYYRTLVVDPSDPHFTVYKTEAAPYARQLREDYVGQV